MFTKVMVRDYNAHQGFKAIVNVVEPRRLKKKKKKVLRKKMLPSCGLFLFVAFMSREIFFFLLYFCHLKLLLEVRLLNQYSSTAAYH